MTGHTPFYPQLDERDCGATCLRMVAEHYGLSFSMERLRQETGTTEKGADLLGLENGAKALGFETLAADLPYDELSQGDLLPVILHWDRDHFVVVTDATLSKVVLHDPAQGKRSMSRDDFEAHRYGPGRSRAGLIIRPSERLLASTGEQETSRKSKVLTSVPFPWKFLMLGLFFAGTLSFVFWTLQHVLQQAIDLQFREGIWQHIGSLLFAIAGLVLSAYLLRKQAITFASTHGQHGINLITEHLKVKASELSKPIKEELYLKLVSDVDDLRVWRAYSLASLTSGVIVSIVAAIFLVATDWKWGAFLVVLQLLLILLGRYVFRSDDASRESAREAQLKQREAFYEFARLLPETQALNGSEYLLDRLEQKNERAEEAFLFISSEVSAERQMIRVLLLVATICLLGFGLYQLGYGGLQVGALLFGMLLILCNMIPFVSIFESLSKWQQLLPARLRLSELEEPSVNFVNHLATIPETLTLVWESEAGKAQKFTFPSSCRVALAGSDKATRNAIVAGLLGRRNDRNARLYFNDDLEKRRTLSAYGKLSLLDSNSTLASGTVASNIAMADRIDKKAVANAGEKVGILPDALPKGLESRIGFQGEGISREMVSKTLIARAIYAEVDALILDGSTDVLPAYDEGILMDNLLEWCKGRLLFTNAERLNAAYGSDLIVSIEATEIASIGSHERLLSEKGTYYYQFVAAENKLT